jgi:hypothetical protein
MPGVLVGIRFEAVMVERAIDDKGGPDTVFLFDDDDDGDLCIGDGCFGFKVLQIAAVEVDVVEFVCRGLRRGDSL